MRQPICTPRRLVAAAVCLAACIVTACSESSGPSDGGFTGHYTLVGANGGGLPYTLYGGLGPPTQLSGGSLQVLGRGRVLDVRVIRIGSVVDIDSTTYAYAVQGDRLVVQRPRINPAQTHADTGTVGADGVTLRVRFLAPDDAGPTSGTLVYQRTR